MKRNLGEVFRVIRESKGLSQKEVVGDSISVAQLSRFERGVSGLSVDSFYECLKNMSVPLDEFQYFYHHYRQKQELPFSVELSEAYLKKNMLKLQKILDECQELVERYPQNRFYKLNVIIVKTVTFYVDASFEVPKKDIQYLMDYLFSVEEWGRYELWLFTNSTGLMTLETLKTFTSEMLKSTQFYKDIPENRKRILQMLLNVIGTCLEKGDMQDAFKFLHQFGQLCQPEVDVMEAILFKYYQGYYAYQNGSSKGIADMEKCAEMMTFLDIYDLARQMTDEIDRLKKKLGKV